MSAPVLTFCYTELTFLKSAIVRRISEAAHRRPAVLRLPAITRGVVALELCWTRL